MTRRARSRLRAGGAAIRGAIGRGMTVLEIMIVLAIIGMLAYLAYSGFRVLSSQALTEDTLDLAAVMRRTQTLSLESGVPVRLVLDFEHEAYWVEACVGDPTLSRAKEESNVSADEVKKRVEAAQERLETLPAGQLKVESAEEATKLAMALAGHDVGGRVCYPVDELAKAGGAGGDAVGALADRLGNVRSFDAVGRDLKRVLQRGRGVKLNKVWVQHLEESVTEGQVSISFFPMGWAEKAIITLTDGRETNAIYLYGLTGRVEVRDGEPRNPDDHLLRDAKGEQEEER